MNIPNMLTLARLIAVPVVVWLIATGRFQIAFWGFLAAGLTDAIDGYLARRLNQRTRLGAYLDAIADKVLLDCIYVTLAIDASVPLWLALIVGFRDLMILGAVMLSWLLEQPMEIKPLVISKLNTAVQIGVAALILAMRGFGLSVGGYVGVFFAFTALLTVASLGAYLAAWIRHMGVHTR